MNSPSRPSITRHDAVVVGCGRMGAFTSDGVRRDAPTCWLPLAHAEAVQSHAALRLVGLSDADPAQLDRALAEYGPLRAHVDAQALIAELRPSLVCIATRTIGRAALIEHAVACGARALHVEKPLCNTVAELQRLETLFARDDLALTLGAVRRHLAPYRQARALVNSGVLGPLREVRVDLGAGALYWTHPHSMDLLLYGAGDRAVRSIAARLENVVDASEPAAVESDPRVVSATVLFDDGVEGRIGSAVGCDWTLVCERGSVTVENDGHRVLIRRTEAKLAYPVWEPAPSDPAAAHAPGGTLAALTRLVDFLGGEGTASVDNTALKRDVLLGQRLLFGAVLSHRQGGIAVSPDALPATLAVWARTAGRPA